MNLRIFITGGSGLLALNWALAVRDRFSVTLGLHEREVALAGVSTRRVDLDSVDDLIRVFKTTQPQIVIHAAGLTSVEKCEAEPGLAQHINAGLASNVAKACAHLNIALAHVSSDHLFSGEAALVDETCPVAPVNIYGQTKAEAESRVLEAYALALVVRTNFYGWGTSYRHSFSDVVIETLRAGKELTLFKDVFYTPILAETATLAVHDLIDLNVSGIYHVVGDERVSKYDFGMAIAEEFNLDTGLINPGLISDQVALVQRPHDMSLANGKTCKLLGRELGGVGRHIARLRQQEHNGIAQEMKEI